MIIVTQRVRINNIEKKVSIWQVVNIKNTERNILTLITFREEASKMTTDV